MKSSFFFLVLMLSTSIMSAQFEQFPFYTGDDLGLRYTPQQSAFRIWCPTAEQVLLRIYENSLDGLPRQVITMQKAEQGTWKAMIKGDQKSKFYTFQATVAGKLKEEVPDPYCRAVGVNGKRAMIVNLAETNPKGWNADKSPAFGKMKDAILYELHVRDASIATNSGIKNKGKFLGLCETGTYSPEGEKTGLDHLRELGVTHVHLLPIFDFYSVNESRLNDPQYNWGYDPMNYNVPEGSYSTNPYDGNIRIQEFKTLVQTFHKNGLNVVMDVVYNHTMLGEASNFNQLVPNYYYRQKSDGSFSDASACGNETASERPMMRKFILESLKYWVQEYHVDGFRFDLMGIHDIATMREIATQLRKIKPTIVLYGEGWTAGDSPLPETDRSLKKYAFLLNGVAVFNDDMRDGLKGTVFDTKDKGFVSGKAGTEESVRFGIVGGINHPQIDESKVIYAKKAYTLAPQQTINYAECHDNHTLWDRLTLSTDATEEEKIKMHLLANTLVLTSQGLPFIHAGAEFMRTKNGEENSFKSPDSINQLDWQRKHIYKTSFDYYKGLIQLRKNHPAFRMGSAEMVIKKLHFIENLPTGVIAYNIIKNANGDSWKDILLVFNANKEAIDVKLPNGVWKIVSNGNSINEKGIDLAKNKVKVAGISSLILRQ